MKYFPLFMNLRGRACLVVGGGGVAARKVALLLRAGARVTVLSPEVHDEIRQWVEQGRLQWERRGWRPGDTQPYRLVIAATDDQPLNRQVAEEAEAAGILVNVVDQPELCSFIMPSIIDRDPVQVAVSTGGASPVLARLLRGRLESTIPAAYGQLARLADEFRQEVQTRVADVNCRRQIWEHALQGNVAELVFAGREEEARAEMRALIEQACEGRPHVGEVYLVGAGPGDPDLLTFRALRLMQQADVVVYDRLVSLQVLDMVRRDAERIYAGKSRGDHTLAQEKINDLLVRLAKEGRRVLRLKGGDPFIFGRGGEEIETLMAEGVRFQVVPGITAASGCSSYAGIPLTHRDYAQACVFVTGHLKDGSIDLDWEMLARPHQTVVVYMGLQGVGVLSREMQAHGLAGSTPVALVERGTTRFQKVYVGTLADLPALVERERPRPPTLIVIGEVVKLRERLNWFNPSRPDGDDSPFSRNRGEKT